MKKISILLFTMLIVFSAVSNAQNKTLPKEWKKEYKRQLKKLEKGGWEIFGSTRSLEYALLSHFEKRCEQCDKPGENGSEMVGVASVSSPMYKELLRQKAVTSVYSSYALKSVNHVKGRIIQELKLKDNNEVENFCAAYASSIEKGIKGELQPSFAVIKEVKENQIDMQVFCIVSKNSELRVCLNALEEIKGQNKFASEYEQQLKSLIKEEFEGK